MQENTIVRGDCLEVLAALPPSTLDLTVTSPPYNLDIAYANGRGDDLPYADYLAWNRRWLELVLAASKPDGRLCLNVPLDNRHHQPVFADFVATAVAAGWQYHTSIVWNENNISSRTAWGSFKSASAPAIISPVEMIGVFYKNQWKKTRRGVSDTTNAEFVDWVLGVWTFSGEKKKAVGGHPAAFPEELPKRCIKLFSYVDDLVFDPFAGSGTTLVTAKKLGRRYLGCELSAEYHSFATARLAAV